MGMRMALRALGKDGVAGRSRAALCHDISRNQLELRPMPTSGAPMGRGKEQLTRGA
jgi:hypothetical protein